MWDEGQFVASLKVILHAFLNCKHRTPHSHIHEPVLLLQRNPHRSSLNCRKTKTTSNNKILLLAECALRDVWEMFAYFIDIFAPRHIICLSLNNLTLFYVLITAIEIVFVESWTQNRLFMAVTFASPLGIKLLLTLHHSTIFLSSWATGTEITRTRTQDNSSYLTIEKDFLVPSNKHTKFGAKWFIHLRAISDHIHTNTNARTYKV